MKVSVVQWRLPKFGLCGDLAFPYRSEKEAVEMFRREYPDAKLDELQVTSFDDEQRLDLYQAYANSGCIRFWKIY